MGCVTQPTSTVRLSLEDYFQDPLFIEVNNVPPPFDVNGHFPYVLWINGERVLYAPTEEIQALIKKVGNNNIRKLNSSDIHAGWLKPHYGPSPQVTSSQ